MAHLILGHVNIFANRAAQGVAECEQALRINRNFANAHSMIGYAKYCMGRAVETEGHVMEALRLSPRDINAYWWMLCLGLANIQLGEYAEAAALATTKRRSQLEFSLGAFSPCKCLGVVRVAGSGAYSSSGRALRSIRASLFVASGLTSRATIRHTSLGLSGSVRACA